MTLRFIKQLVAEDDLFRWGVLPGRYFYIADYFEILSKDFSSYAPLPWPRLVLLLNGNEMQVIGRKQEVDRQGTQLFTSDILSMPKREHWFRACEEGYQVIKSFIQQQEFEVLLKLSRADLIAFGERFSHVMKAFWLPTMVVELANYGGWAIVHEEYGADRAYELIDKLKFKKPTFYQTEEHELCLNNDIRAHQRRYFWLANNYAHCKELSAQDFAQRQRFLRARKEESVIPSASVNTADRVITCLSESLWYQQERKQYILQLQHYKGLFLNAAATHISAAKEELYDYSFNEIVRLLRGEHLAPRGALLGADCEDAKFIVLSKSVVSYAWQLLADRSTQATAMSVLVSQAQAIVTGPVVFWEQGDLEAEDSIMVTHTLTCEQLHLIGKVKAIVVENYTSITHAVFMAYACKYTKADERPALVVIPTIYDLVKPGQVVTIDLLRKEIHTNNEVWLGQVASRNTDPLLQGTVVIPEDNFTTESILVVQHLTLELLFRYREVKCILSEEGGLTSHVSIICRELGIPYITGIKNITQLHSGDMIEVDFKKGSVHRFS